MNKKTVIKNILEVKAEDLKNNLVENFLDVIADYKNEALEDLNSQINYLQESLNNMQRGNWKELFKDGATMMMLDKDSFEYVDNYFIGQKKNPALYSMHEIEIHILPSEDFPFEDKVVIEEKDIQY